MKVYVIMYSPSEELSPFEWGGIEKVFSTEAKAKKWIDDKKFPKKYLHFYDILEFEIE